jgi:alcohol dehydrogenase class IV
MKGVTLPTETVFVMEASPIKFGLGATDEIAYDVRRLGLKRVLIVTDRHIGELGLPDRIRLLLEEEGVKADVYDGVEIEPTDRSMEEAAEYARQRELDGFIAVGGGSALDTCKAVNLLTTYPAPLLDYINQPVGKGRPVPGPLKPLIAVPTTAGTGSETTAVAVTHVLAHHVKAGVSHRLLRPALGIVDPLNTLTAPPEVTAAAGCDILTHAIESYTTRPYNARAKHHPPDRPAYIGANPASDIWCEKAIEYVGKYLRRGVRCDARSTPARQFGAIASTLYCASRLAWKRSHERPLAPPYDPSEASP